MENLEQETQTTPPTQSEPPKSNWLHSKLFGYGFLVVIFVVAVAGIYQWQYGRTNNNVIVTNFEECIAAGNPALESYPRQCQTSDGQSFVEQIDETANWQTYRNEEFGYELKYPQNFMLKDEAEQVTISHGVPYTHNDTCDMSGETLILNEVVDFNATIQVFNGNLESAVNATYTFSDDILENGQFKLSPSFVDAYSVASLNGHRVNIGVEGCGVNIYYFPLDVFRTLVINQEFSPSRTPLILDYEKFLSLPGIISPEDEEKIFDQILSTFKFIESSSAAPKLQAEIVNVGASELWPLRDLVLTSLAQESLELDLLIDFSTGWSGTASVMKNGNFTGESLSCVPESGVVLCSFERGLILEAGELITLRASKEGGFSVDVKPPEINARGTQSGTKVEVIYINN